LEYHGAVLSVDHGSGKPGEIDPEKPAFADELIMITGFGLYCESPFVETILATGFWDGEGFDDDPFFCRCRNFILFVFSAFGTGSGADR